MANDLIFPKHVPQTLIRPFLSRHQTANFDFAKCVENTAGLAAAMSAAVAVAEEDENVVAAANNEGGAAARESLPEDMFGLIPSLLPPPLPPSRPPPCRSSEFPNPDASCCVAHVPEEERVGIRLSNLA